MQVFKNQMMQRRESQNKTKEDGKEGEPASAQNHVQEAPATGLEAMMGLDDMGEMDIPLHLLGNGGGFQGGGGMTEDQMIAAAIQASLAEMSLEGNQEQPTNQIS